MGLCSRLDLEAGTRKGVSVQVRPPAPTTYGDSSAPLRGPALPRRSSVAIAVGLFLAVAACTARAAVVDLTVSPPDRAGRFTVSYDPGPTAIYQRDGLRAWDYYVPIPAGGTVCEVRSFLGWDRGSIGEASIELNALGQQLYERHDHKETLADYDAWAVRTVRLEVPAGTSIHMHVGANMITENSDGGWSTRVHFAFRLRMTTGTCD